MPHLGSHRASGAKAASEGIRVRARNPQNLIVSDGVERDEDSGRNCARANTHPVVILSRSPRAGGLMSGGMRTKSNLKFVQHFVCLWN